MNLSYAFMLLTDKVKDVVKDTGEIQNPTFFEKYGMLIFLVLIFVAMYFIMIRPQKKKQKKEEEMRNNVQIGDEIITIGGFYGKICAMKDDAFIIESLVDGTKQQIVKSALQTVITIHDEQ